MSLTIPQFEEQNWLCLRCYRVNSNYNTDKHCDYGCGYTTDSGSTILTYDWQCPKCWTKNMTKMYRKCECSECHYRPNINEIYGKK